MTVSLRPETGMKLMLVPRQGLGSGGQLATAFA
jgi:hypothetical protein